MQEKPCNVGGGHLRQAEPAKLLQQVQWPDQVQQVWCGGFELRHEHCLRHRPEQSQQWGSHVGAGWREGKLPQKGGSFLKMGLFVCLCVCLLVRWFVGLLVCWFVGLLVCRFLWFGLFFCLIVVCLFVCLFVGSLVCWLVGLLVSLVWFVLLFNCCLFVSLFVCLFVCLFVLLKLFLC